ncbi:MIP/aquaporin family protein [Streptomyces sp. TRM70350]|uniref:MIP/aquaporin family protein n=1 Tax=Streptomyces sp. TRM70350 TaxID=2856165 RepID=UPI001C4845D0|nr:MIP/aquaporin family protein [Streptomyces sp. TRM70350]MBV7695607.1 aquaporin family protein [Streptomyces sp. TRM70350]
MSNGDVFVGEIIGTAILILFGAGVCAAVTLRYSKARASDWIVIAFAWGLAVTAGAYTAAPLPGGHIDPAVTLGIAVDTGVWGKVWVYVLGQLVGALLGAVLAYLEIIATIALVLPILAFGLIEGLGASGTTVLIVSLLVVGIGLSLGGPTGHVINPARDLGPRIVHTLPPIPNKGTSDWGDAWIPAVGPLGGGTLVGLIYNAAFSTEPKG